METTALTANLAHLNPPIEAYLFFPKESEKVVPKGKNKYMRWFFDGELNMLPHEKQKMDEFNAFLAKKKETAACDEPKNSNNQIIWTTSLKLRFLDACQFHNSDTLKAIKEHNAWAASALPPQLTQPTLQILTSQIVYFSGIDNRFRPIFVLNLYKIDTKIFSLEQILAGVTYFIESIINRLFLPGQVENWVIIQDLNKQGITSLPMSTFKSIICYLMDHYRSRLFRLYSVNTPSSLGISWSIVKMLLDETTVQKIQFEDSNIPKGLFTHAHPSQIETKFGGTAGIIEQSWPPIAISEHWAREEDKLEEFLITKEEYQQRYNNGQLGDYKICQDLMNNNKIENQKVNEDTITDAVVAAFAAVELTEKQQEEKEITEQVNRVINNGEQQEQLEQEQENESKEEQAICVQE